MVHPGVTILVADGLFSFCHLDYCEDFTVFADRYAEGVAAVKEEPTMVTPGRDDLLFMSAIPWISFTSFSHPVPTLPPDSIPRFAWGKVFGEEGRLKMPLEADGHHALMDGIHMGRFYGLVQDYLDHPDFLLSAAG
jgi:chloramphenicol O-acetyltransferase type A